MRAGNSCKRSLSVREFSVRVLWVFLLIGYLVSPAWAVDFWDIMVADGPIDSSGYHSLQPSLAILSSGYPAISYCGKSLVYTWYDGSAWHTTTVDSGGQYSSLAMLPSGQPAISYSRHSNYIYSLKYAWYDGSDWQITTVDSNGSVGAYNSLAILPSGYPAIGYFDWTNGDLKYAWYDGSSWQTTTVDSAAYAFGGTSLTILPSGMPAISYRDYTLDNSDLKYAWFDGSVWHTEVVDSAGDVGWGSSLVVLPSGQPAISYFDNAWYNNNVKYAWYNGSTWQTETVDRGWSDGSYTSLAILPSGQPAVAYRNQWGGLIYAWHDGSDWQTTTVDDFGGMGVGGSKEMSLVILPSGEPAIGYSNTQFGGPHGSDWLYLKFASGADIGPAPVQMEASYTATAQTDLGGTTVVIDGPAYNEGLGTALNPEGASSSVSLETTDGHHLLGVVRLQGADGEECDWDPEIGEICSPVSCRDASGKVTGTIIVGTSESYPTDSELDLALEVFACGDPGDTEDYYLKLWRGVALLGQIDQAAPNCVDVPVLAGEVLTFELFASEEDWYGDYEGYDCGFEFRLILRGPANLDGIASVDFRDFAIFGLAWKTEPGDAAWDPNCDISDPNDDIIDNNDLDVFTDHWLE